MDKGTDCYRRFREEGDDEALAEIIIEYRDGLIFYLNSFVGDLGVAEELAEDTFVLLGTKKTTGQGDRFVQDMAIYDRAEHCYQ